MGENAHTRPDELRVPPPAAAPPPVPDRLGPVVGTIGQHIGTGEHAQTAIVYTAVKWSFTIGAATSAVIVVFAWLKGSSSVVADVKEVWTVFVPVITLALGYLFGKGRA